jgi:hypothetical protein
MFQSRAEELQYVFSKFVLYLSEIFTEIGRPNPDLLLLSEAPVIILCAKAQEIMDNYGEDLDKEDMTAVFKVIIAQASDAQTVKSMSEDASMFIQYLEDNPEKKARFFRFTRALKIILLV